MGSAGKYRVDQEKRELRELREKSKNNTWPCQAEMSMQYACGIRKWHL
jgi:hypothetical protein